MDNHYGYSDDCIVMDAGGRRFYYGYEETKDNEWCFVVSRDGTEKFRAKTSELDSRDSFDVVENFLAGMVAYFGSKKGNG